MFYLSIGPGDLISNGMFIFPLGFSLPFVDRKAEPLKGTSTLTTE